MEIFKNPENNETLCRIILPHRVCFLLLIQLIRPLPIS